MEQRPHIALITVDTLRRDHCGCYGYHRDITPFIDDMAGQGAQFSHAYANGPLTPRSFPSILVGRHAFYGKEDNPHSYHLPREAETIAQRLQQHGYRTAAFQAGNPFISSFYGYDRGFDSFNDFLEDKGGTEQRQFIGAPPRLLSQLASLASMSPSLEEMAKKVYWRVKSFAAVKRCQQKLENNQLPFVGGTRLNTHIAEQLPSPDTAPVFLWIHYMDVHPPYIVHPDLCAALDIPAYDTETVARHWAEISNHHIKSQRQLRELLNLYDGEIAHCDRCIKQLIGILAEKGITPENTLFILTADHGEEFGEHGGLGHHLKLYNEMLSIPLIMWGNKAGAYNRYTDKLVELRDIPAVIADSAGIELMDDCSHRYVISQSLRRGRAGWIRLISVQDTSHKLIYDTGEQAYNEFYDLQGDPAEQHNRIEDPVYTEQVRKMTALARAFARYTSKTAKLRRESRHRIRQLKQQKDL